MAKPMEFAAIAMLLLLVACPVSAHEDEGAPLTSVVKDMRLPSRSGTCGLPSRGRQPSRRASHR